MKTVFESHHYGLQYKEWIYLDQRWQQEIHEKAIAVL